MRIDAHHHVWDLAVRDQVWTRDLPVLRCWSLRLRRSRRVSGRTRVVTSCPR